MTSVYPDAQTVDSLRPIARQLRSAGPTTSRRRVVIHVLGIGTALVAAAGPFGLVGDLTAAIVVAGLFLHADAMQHEAVHRHVARTATGNRLVGLIASAPMLVPYSLYGAFHLAHHAYTAQPGDPEGPHEPSDRWPWLIEAARTARFWVLQWVVSIRTLVGSPPSYVRTDRQLNAVRFDTVITLVVGVALAWGSYTMPVVRWIWLVPFLAYVLLLFPLFHTYEHSGAEARITSDGVSDSIGLTSTLRLPKPISAALWHATLHTAHHAFPSVPWQRLPELQAHLDGHLPADLVHDSLCGYLRSPRGPVPQGEAVEGQDVGCSESDGI